MKKVVIDKLALISIKNRRVLETLSHGKNVWYIPGGKREIGESDFQALFREIKEELRVDIIPETMKLYGVFEDQAHGKPEGHVIKMTCYTAEYSGSLAPDNEVAKFDYFDYSKRNEVSAVDQLVFDSLKSRNLID